MASSRNIINMHITFDLDVEADRRAYEAVLAASTERKRSGFILGCILQHGDNAAFADMVAKKVREMLVPQTQKRPLGPDGKRPRGRPPKFLRPDVNPVVKEAPAPPQAGDSDAQSETINS